MDISGVTSAKSAVASNFIQSLNNDRSEKAAARQQPSTEVNISDMARKLNEAKNTERTAAPNATQEGGETKPKEAAETPGIQFVESESRGGKVNTFA